MYDRQAYAVWPQSGYTADMSEPFYLGLQRRGVLALPPSLRKQLHLDQPGAQVEVLVRADGVVELRPHVAIPGDQAWVWSESWQSQLKESLSDLKAGRVVTHASDQDFLDSLK
jgi:hypothetical protein